MRRIVGMLTMVLTLSGCRSTADSATAVLAAADTRAARFEAALARPDVSTSASEPLARWILPASLREISGLALTANGRLFTHGDEQGTVWEVDYRRGLLVKQFTLGQNGVKADFEGITVAGDAIFMIASNGKLYEFREGANGARVDYDVHDTELGKECEFEGVAFDAASKALLLACKNVKVKKFSRSLLIYRWKLEKGDGPRLEPMAVPLERAIGENGWKDLHPSDITVDPATGNYVVIASQERALVVITPSGEVVLSKPLPGKSAQPEGVAVTGDGVLIVSDEARRGAAALTVYRWPGAK